MATETSFDQWQKDVFFSAAEEVQESTDTLESVYRMWMRLESDEFQSEMADELFQELRIALGTAKWQLDEFERAVCLRHEDPSTEKYRVTRHKEFVAVIGNQIAHIEKAVNSSLEESNQPLCWVRLDKEESDDLESFLSAPSKVLQVTKDRYTDHDLDRVQVRTRPLSAKGFKETLAINKDSRYVVEVAAKESCKSKHNIFEQEEQLDGHSGTRSSPEIGSWKIIIADDEESDSKMGETKLKAQSHASGLCSFVRGVEAAAKTKLSRKNFPKAKSGEYLQLRRGFSKYLDLKGITRLAKGINGLSERSKNCFRKCREDPKISYVQQLVGRAGALQLRTQGSQSSMQYGCSLRIPILLLLTIILVDFDAPDDNGTSPSSKGELVRSTPMVWGYFAVKNITPAAYHLE